MAFDRTRLALLAGTNSKAPRLFGYKTDDTAATVDSANYFNTAFPKLKVGDVILRVTVTNLDASNEAVSTVGLHVVNGAGIGAVDVTDALALTVTDTD